MAKGASGTLKLCLVISIIVLAGIGILYAIGAFGSEEARDLAVKTMWIMGILTAAMLLIMLVSGFGVKSKSEA